MSHEWNLRADAALERLRQGNAAYLNSAVNRGDISPARRLHTYQNGQSPYAVIIACSDSRVIPECIFSAGIGELFVIRVAGNVIDRHQLGSIEYAADHLGCRLVVVLGHTDCGAVGAALSGNPGGFVQSITDEIGLAIGAEKDPYRASCRNVEHSVHRILHDLGLSNEDDEGLHVVGAMYHIDSGKVDFM